MNRKRQRYGVALKLIMLLALVGCFFIAKKDVVKAAEPSITANIDPTSYDVTIVFIQGDSTSTTKWYGLEVYLKKDTTTIPLLKIEDTTNPLTSKTKAVSAMGDSGYLKVAYDQKYAPGKYTVCYKTATSEGNPLSYGAEAELIGKDVNIFTVAGKNTTHITSFGIISSNNSYPNVTCEKLYCVAGAEATVTAVPQTGYRVKAWEPVTSPGEKISASGREITVKVLNATASAIECQPIEAEIVDSVILVNGATEYTNGATIPVPVGTAKEFTSKHVIGGTKSTGNVKWVYTSNSNYVITPLTNEMSNTLSVTALTSGATITVQAIAENASSSGTDVVGSFTFLASEALNSVSISKTPSSGDLYTGQNIGLSAVLNPSSASASSYTWTCTGVTGGDAGTTAADLEFSSTSSASTTVSSSKKGKYTVQVSAVDALNGPPAKTATIILDLKEGKLTKLEFGADTYEVTVGYKVSTTVQATPTAALVSDDVNFSLPSETTATIASSSENETTGVATAVVKGVKSGDVTLTAKGKTNTTVTDTAKIKVYASPADSSAFKYTESTRVLKGALPDKVLVGNTSYDIDKVTGFKIYVMKGSEQLGTITYKDKGTTGESSASDLESIIKDNAGKFSGDTDTIKLRAVALGTYGSSSDIREAKDESGNLLAWESEVKVYRVSVSGTGITGSQTYGLQGQKVSLTATPAAGYTSVKWSNGSTSTVRDDITVSSTTSSNQLKAEGVLGANTATDSTSGDGYDDVPKTGQNQIWFFVIPMAVFATIGAAWALWVFVKPAWETGEDKEGYGDDD